MTHYRDVCEFGFNHGQCRCPSKDKTVRTVKCTVPIEHHQRALEEAKKILEPDLRKVLTTALWVAMDNGEPIDGKIVYDPDDDDYFLHVTIDDKTMVFGLLDITT